LVVDNPQAAGRRVNSKTPTARGRDRTPSKITGPFL